MPRVVGIDPGTLSFDLFGLHDGRPFLDESLAPADVARNPALLVDRLRAASPLDLVVAPSGYGLPLVPVGAVTDDQLALCILATAEDRRQPELVGGLRPVLTLLRSLGLPGVLVPGVIHLPTVPAHRKVNRIDMGTADKVCAAALAIRDQAGRLGTEPAGTSFILVELGGAFTAGVAVAEGRIVDGSGGSSGALGYRALGTLDGEVAYALGHVRKATLFTGGAAFIAGEPELPPEELAERAAAGGQAGVAWDAFLESVDKMVAALRVSAPSAREVLLSGRLARVERVAAALTARLSGFGPVRVLEGFVGRAKEAAQGAALIADGLAGGSARSIVDALRLREAHGTILDHLYVTGADAIREQFGLPRR
jgi:predicted butyrate kinase (DUF1464 family)